MNQQIIEENKIVEEKPLLIPVEHPEEYEEMSTKKNRDRTNVLPDRLPTYQLMPFPIDEHKHIGNYETKHNLYLTLAHSFNKAMERIEALEREIAALKNTANPQ